MVTREFPIMSLDKITAFLAMDTTSLSLPRVLKVEWQLRSYLCWTKQFHFSQNSHRKLVLYTQRVTATFYAHCMC